MDEDDSGDVHQRTVRSKVKLRARGELKRLRARHFGFTLRAANGDSDVPGWDSRKFDEAGRDFSSQGLNRTSVISAGILEDLNVWYGSGLHDANLPVVGGIGFFNGGDGSGRGQANVQVDGRDRPEGHVGGFRGTGPKREFGGVGETSGVRKIGDRVHEIKGSVWSNRLGAGSLKVFAYDRIV